MCGFAIFHSGVNGQLPSEEALYRASDALKNRGPDEASLTRLSDSALVHRRLSIVGGASGRQPLTNGRGTLSVLFNGEIYNHLAIREELSSLGYVFSTSTDGEVLVHGFEQWGPDLFRRLDGIFSVAFINHTNKEVTLVRDRHGVKPLYYFAKKSGISAGSTVGAVKEMSTLKRKDVSPSTLDQYLRLGFNLPGTTFHPDVFEVMPGSYVTWSTHKPEVSSFTYWDVKSAMEMDCDEITKSNGRELLIKAITSQSYDNSGIFLSSGIDSAIISTVLSRNNSQLRHYTASFPNTNNNEWERVLELYASKNMDMQEVQLDEKLAIDIDYQMTAFEMPFADNAAIPTMRLAEAASNNHKVVFSGDGADELFLGYRNHKMLFLEHKLKKIIPEFAHSTFGLIVKKYPNSKSLPSFLRAFSTLNTFNRTWAESYTDAISIIDRENLNSAYKKTWLKAINPVECQIMGSMSHASDLHPMKQVQAMDWLFYLPGSVLTKVDRSTMAFGVEARVPFLSNGIVDKVIQLPYSENLSLLQGKSSLRSWCSDFMQENRRAKVPFVNPLFTWLTHQPLSFFRKNVLHDAILDQPWFEKKTLEKFIVELQRGDHRFANFIWATMVLSSYIQSNK